MTAEELFRKCNKKEGWKLAGRDVQYCIDVDDERKKLYLYFQCSMSLRDDIVNLIALPFKTKIGDFKFWGHIGYVRYFNSAYKEVFTDFDKVYNEHKDYEVTFVGYSLGGPMAHLHAFYCYDHLGIKPKVVTFGATKVFKSKRAANECRNRISEAYGFAKHNDIAPKWPFTYKYVSKIPIGDKFNFFELFKFIKNHFAYDDVEYPEKYDF